MNTPYITPVPGRQLFVDDTLIESTDMQRIWHEPVPYQGNPVLKPETDIEMNNGIAPVATVFNDGCWFDPQDQLYKLYYHTGWYTGTALALSKDGIHWIRPDLGIVPGTNLLFQPDERRLRDGSLCWLDLQSENPEERWKMFLYFRYPQENREGGSLFTSADGIHWRDRGETGSLGDNSSFFRDPFQNKWCFSIRDYAEKIGRKRTLMYRDHFTGSPWNEVSGKNLQCDESDILEIPEPSCGEKGQLYDFNAAPYESLMLGVMAVFEGPENNIALERGCPKTIHLHYAFSRNGENWFRPEQRKPFLRCSRKENTWNRGYLHAAGGIALVFQDKIRFYYGGWSGKSTLGPGECGPRRDESAVYASGSVGFADLRRDGFASMRVTDGCGCLRTPLLKVKGKYLWINAAGKDLQIELQDSSGVPLPGYAFEDCLCFSGDSVKYNVRWKNHSELPDVPELKVAFRLYSGDLYSFWFSETETGESGGYVAAGSQDYPGDRDI